MMKYDIDGLKCFFKVTKNLDIIKLYQLIEFEYIYPSCPCGDCYEFRIFQNKRINGFIHLNKENNINEINYSDEIDEIDDINEINDINEIDDINNKELINKLKTKIIRCRFCNLLLSFKNLKFECKFHNSFREPSISNENECHFLKLHRSFSFSEY